MNDTKVDVQALFRTKTYFAEWMKLRIILFSFIIHFFFNSCFMFQSLHQYQSKWRKLLLKLWFFDSSIRGINEWQQQQQQKIIAYSNDIDGIVAKLALHDFTLFPSIFISNLMFCQNAQSIWRFMWQSL